MHSSIAKITFLTSLISYGVFLLFEYLRPGFVSFVFSIHWFLIVIVGCGIWLCRSEALQSEGRWVGVYQKEVKGRFEEIGGRLMMLIIGLLLMIILLREGEVFGDFRILIGLAGLVLPFVLARGLK